MKTYISHFDHCPGNHISSAYIYYICALRYFALILQSNSTSERLSFTVYEMKIRGIGLGVTPFSPLLELKLSNTVLALITNLYIFVNDVGRKVRRPQM